jgi:hypothetical protein
MSSSPQQLFDSCKSLEEQTDLLNIDALRRHIAKGFIFRPIFDAADSGTQVRDKIEEAIWRGSKYRDLIRLLQKVREPKGRWIVLARWLRQEKVCEPEDFLPEEANLDSLAREFWKGTRREEPIHVSLVESWLPYFQQLRGDIRTLREQDMRRVVNELVNRGYDRDASAIAAGKRSVFEAVYSWLQFRRRVSSETFRNAYSRFRRSVEKLPPDVVARTFARELEELAQQGRTAAVLSKPKSARKQRTKKSR